VRFLGPELSPGQAGFGDVYRLAGGWRPGAWIRVASLAKRAKACQIEGAHTGPLRGAVYPDFWTHLGRGVFWRLKGMVVDHGDAAGDGVWPQGKPMLRPSGIGNGREPQTLLRSHGSAGWFAS